MKLNHILSLLALSISAGLFTACMDGDWEAPVFEQAPYGNNDIQQQNGEKVITIRQLKSRFASAIENGSAIQITDDLQLQAIVNGNDEGGNIYKQISIQDGTGGLIVGINASDLFPYLPVGQQVLISLKDLYIGGYGKQAQLGNLYNGSIGRMDTDVWEQHVRLLKPQTLPLKVDTVEVSGTSLNDNLCGRIVKLSDITISGEGTQTLAPEDGSVKLTSNCANRNINGKSTIVLRTSSYSDFASHVIPKGKVDLYGVCTRFNNTWQILMRTESDLVEK